MLRQKHAVCLCAARWHARAGCPVRVWGCVLQAQLPWALCHFDATFVRGWAACFGKARCLSLYISMACQCGLPGAGEAVSSAWLLSGLLTIKS